MLDQTAITLKKSPSEQLRPGDSFGDFYILDTLVDAFFFTLFQVQRMSDDTYCTLCCPAPILAFDDGFKEALMASFPRLQRLSHDNILAYQEIVCVGRCLCLVCENWEGKAVTCKDEPQTAAILQQVIDAFRVAHKHNVLHLVLAPSMLLANSDRTIKIVGFGLLACVSSALFTALMRDWFFQIDDSFRGFSPFACVDPRVILEQEETLQSDIFSIGAIVYWLLTRKKLSLPFIKPSQINPDIKDYWDNMISLCVDLQRERRYASIVELQYQLIHFRQLNKDRWPADPPSYLTAISQAVSNFPVTDKKNFRTNIHYLVIAVISGCCLIGYCLWWLS